jgi:hypothetical protein
VLKRNLILVSASALVSSLLAAPIVADVIAYRTEDGVFAYTDDAKKVPTRYAADAVTVRDSALQTYPRLTLEDTTAARAVTSRLEKRLDYLRQLNAASDAERAVAANASPQSSTVISIPTGPTGNGASSPSIEVAANSSSEPLVVEPILTKESNRVRTRRATIVKQGDKILAIMKGPQHHFDVTSDIHDEDSLLEQR